MPFCLFNRPQNINRGEKSLVFFVFAMGFDVTNEITLEVIFLCVFNRAINVTSESAQTASQKNNINLLMKL